MSHLIYTNQAPLPIGPYSQAVQAGDFIFCSGQVGLDPHTNKMATGITEQTKQTLENIQAILAAADSSLNEVVRCELFLSDLNHFTLVNELYSQYFTQDPKPARFTVQVAALPKGALIEIACTAYHPLPC